MLNKHGNGELYFGVKDNGDVIGQDVTDSTMRQVSSWISEKISPAISPTIERLTSDGRKDYIRVAFSGTEAPYSADGRYYTRIGASNKPMTPAELQTMMLERVQRRSPWDSLPSGRPVSDVSEQAVRDFVRRGNEASRINTEFTSVLDVLERLGMIADNGTLCNAAEQLFCKGPDIYPRMKLGLLAGNTKAKILDLRQECGTLFELLDLAEHFVASNIRHEFVIGETGMYRKEIPEIPTEAIREAIANALCHRDYLTGTAVEINVYMDTVEIVNPGLFPEGDSPERHLEGRAGSFQQRNPTIADALFHAGVIERYGTGTPRIKEACEASGVGFRYSQAINTTTVAFNRRKPQATIDGDAQIGEGGSLSHSKAGAISPKLFAALDSREKLAVRLATERGKVTPRELAEADGSSRKTAGATLKELTSKGILIWSGKSANDPYQFYRLPWQLGSTGRHWEAK